MRDKLEEIFIVLDNRPRALVIAIVGIVLCTLVNIAISYLASLATGPFQGMLAVFGQLSPWVGLALFGLYTVVAIQRYQRDRDDLFPRF